MVARYRRWNPCRKGAMWLAVSCLVAGCAGVGRPGQRPPSPPANPVDIRAFARWSSSALQRRAAQLERRVLTVAPGSPTLAPYRHRLATVYLALSWREKNQAARHGLRRHELGWWQNIRRQQLQRAFQLHDARAKQYHWRAIRQWLEVVHSTSSHLYEHLDELLWRSADALLTVGETEARHGWPAQVRRRRGHGYALLERLVRRHPTSRYVGRALLGLGTALQRRGHPETAALAFGKVLRGPWTASFAQAHLGLARCLLEVNRPRAALRHLERSHRLAGTNDDRSTIRDALFTAWVVAGKASEAYAFARRVAGGGVPARKLYLALATWCGYSGRPTLAMDLWQRARRLWPRDKRRCVWWETALTATLEQQRWHATQQLLDAAPTLLSGLSRQLGTKARPVQRCRTRMSNTLRRVATKLHVRNLRRKQLAELNVSRRAYALHSVLFPKSPIAFLMKRQHADLLWLMVQRNLRTSGPTVRQVAKIFDRLARRPRPPTQDPKAFHSQRQASALTAVRSWLRVTDLWGQQNTRLERGLAGPRRCLKRRAKQCLRWTPPSLRRRALNADHRGFRQAALYYLRVARAEGVYRGSVRFLVGHVHWLHNQFSEALPHLLAVAWKNAEDRPSTARAAAFRAYHILTALGKGKAATRLLDRVLGHRRLMEDYSYRRRMKGLRFQVRWSRAHALRQQKRWRQCGPLFEQIARSDLIPKGRYPWLAAARCYEAAGQPPKAIRALRAVASRGASSRHAPAATLRVARLFQQLAQLRWAAKWYIRYVDSYPERTDAPAVHLTALRIRVGLGRRHTLLTGLRSFFGRYATTHPKLAARARWLWIRFERAQGQTQALPGLLQGWLKRHARHAAPDRVLEARLLLATLAWRRSCRVALTRGRCLAAPLQSPKGGRARRPLLRRAPKLLRLAHGLLNQAQRTAALRRVPQGVPAGVPNRRGRLHRARLNVRQVASLLAKVRRYRACERAPRCRSGRAAPSGIPPKAPQAGAERYRKITAPTFRSRPATFDGRPLRTTKPKRR